MFSCSLQIDHIVLGRGPPGGSWHTFPRTVRTLSPAAWLALPPHTSASVGDVRLSARAVAQYCRRYVHACKLQVRVIIFTTVGSYNFVVSTN